MPASVSVNRRAADRLASGHPWIFASDVTNRGSAEPGAAVAIQDPRGNFLGAAHYSSTSQIALRLLTRRAAPVDREFYKARLSAAIEHRKRVVSGSNACRLVHAEADLLPGLIVDRYGEVVVIQTLTQGMARAQEDILDCIEELIAPKAIVARNDVPVRRKEGLAEETGVLRGQIPDAVEVEMNGVRLSVDPLRGQKTGLFLDQRENYLAAGKWSAGPALDCFTGSGGFALHLARAGATVEAIDSSAPALEIARGNRDANGFQNIEFRRADVFEYLGGCSRQFRTIVLDPPAFAKSRDALENAARGYKEINFRAFKLLEPGGVLVSCSCSHHMSEAAFLEVVAEASLDAGRTVRVLERRTQAMDHPILLTVPETMYLKCIILQA